MTGHDRTTAGTAHAFVIAEEIGQRLDLFVASRCDLSRTQAATLIANGHVTVNEKLGKASYKTDAGDRIGVLIPPPQGRDIVPEQIPLSVVYEDEHLVVIDKPAGMVVHPAPGNWSGTLVNALMGRGEPLAEGGGADRPGLVHRLDKETSGLLVVAKTDVVHRKLSALIAARHVTRRYALLSWGHLKEDFLRVDKPIDRDPKDRTRMAIVPTGKAAKTDFMRLARFDSADLLRAHLHTGRTHQIRVHLQSVGHPVVGDDTYGGGGGRRLAELPPKRFFLHAAWLRFRHPITGEELDLRAPMPDDLRRSIAAIGGMPELVSQEDPLDVFRFFHVDDPNLPIDEPLADA
jgi:23S rRNA pseudouridine1911/1915/1917 synthase